MVSFASSVTMGGARKPAWTKNKRKLWAPLASFIGGSVGFDVFNHFIFRSDFKL